MPRRVNAAMEEERGAKQRIRKLWIETVIEIEERHPGSTPLYMSLSGAGGRDIELMLAREVVRRTEV